ncbi:hypothetical protein GF325_07210 [Candidatus Bathyarchaeota archaeon]|nr:hypothetical protein [Candidatus Bathyarchaeota archaeon]
MWEENKEKSEEGRKFITCIKDQDILPAGPLFEGGRTICRETQARSW